jgi:transposase
VKLSLEQRAKIRRLFYAEHWPVGTIASELHLHHDTVRRALGVECLQPAGADLAKPSILAPYKEFIQHTLQEHPRLRASRAFEMVKSRGYPGGVAQVRRYVRTVRPARAEAYLRLSTLPGEQAQVDWGSFGKLRIGHAQRTLSCFVLVLSWSRAMYARFMLDQSLENFLRGHVEAFAELGGVPRAILYDNLKSVVLERQGDAIRFHPRLLELAGHYHFAPKPCAPYRGNEKGKVERTIRYLRDSFFAARNFSSLTDLNAQLDRWIADVAHQRRFPGDASGRRVTEALLEEQPKLLPLPAHRFETDLVVAVASGKTPYVRFDGNDYSIPHVLIRKPLTVVATESTVRILNGSAEVARHRRSWDKGQVLEDAAHIAALAKQKRAAHELRGRDLLRTVCKSSEVLIAALAERGENLGGHTSKLLTLLDRYGATELERAIADALRRGAVSADAVAHVLDQRRRRRKQPPPLQVLLPDDPRVRDLRVPQHELATYDALAAPNERNDAE